MKLIHLLTTALSENARFQLFSYFTEYLYKHNTECVMTLVLNKTFYIIRVNVWTMLMYFDSHIKKHNPGFCNEMVKEITHE